MATSHSSKSTHSSGASHSKSKSTKSHSSSAKSSSKKTTKHDDSKSAHHSSSQVTTDHDEIREWVEARGGRPACVKTTGDKGDIGLLRIDYPGYGDDSKLQEISWCDFFEKFDKEKLAFLYQDETADGKESRFSKLISRENT